MFGPLSPSPRAPYPPESSDLEEKINKGIKKTVELRIEFIRGLIKEAEKGLFSERVLVTKWLKQVLSEEEKNLQSLN